MDMTTLLGLAIAFIGIIGGQILEGGHIGSLVQLTAGLIVLGGTAGAVFVSTTKKDLLKGIRLLKLGFKNDDESKTAFVVQEIVESAQLARKDSILALDRRINNFSNPFMKSVFRFVVDGVDPNTLREIFEAEIDLEEENEMAGAKIWIDAGGYSPTIGIIGAVLGLIHVMENLTDTSKLGSGIAVAFVATIYGVGLANLVLLPIGAKIKRKIRQRVQVKMMIVEGAIDILNGLNPYLIEHKLKSYLNKIDEVANGS
jgi:chemotaxis protein MotA